jgi:hypothetical protein
MASVTLHFFEGYDFEHDKVVRSRRPATMEFIQRLHLHPVADNSVEVDSAQVDAEGLLAGDS